ncbi:MAG: GatB/YqeY domain-containing protein [Planctomycetota bacterium]
MSLQERIQSDLKDAMRSGDTETRDTLRMTVAALKNKRIELGREPDETEALQVLQKAVKTRQDSATQYDDANRPELAAKERAEIGVLERYLPAKKSDDEVEAIVAAAIEESGASSKADLGRVMKAVMAKHRGEVDGKAVQTIAGRLLG